MAKQADTKTVNIEPKEDLLSVDRLFFVYRSLWMAGKSPALDLVSDLLAAKGLGAVHGYLVPDGSYFNEQDGEINGKVNVGNRVWSRETGWQVATEKKGE